MNPNPEQQRECPQPHSHCRPLSLTGKSAYPTSTDIESFINLWTLNKMMQYDASFVSNFLNSKLCLGFTHDVIYCSTLLLLFFFITVEYDFEWSHGHVLISSIDSLNLSCFQFLTITNMILQLTIIMMSLDANMCYLLSMFNPWSFILFFLIKWCPLMNSFLNLMET